MKPLFCQPIFSIFEFYAGNYASAFECYQEALSTGQPPYTEYSSLEGAAEGE